jgi:hypothetical protein
LVITHEAATRDHDVVNTGAGDLVVFTFLGPDLQDAPVIEGRKM